jgi:hypothetical protein
MSSMRTVGLCLMAVVTMSVALAGSATATPLWLLCVKGSNSSNTKYEGSSCTKAAPSGEWESVELKGTEKVIGVGFTLTQRDTKTIGGPTAIRCDSGGRSEGVVGPGNKGKVTVTRVEAPSTNCRPLEGLCETVEKIEAVNLPWNSEIFETEKKILSTAATSGSGEPGLTVTCKTPLGSKTDSCTVEAGKLENSRLEDLISNGVLLILGTAEKLRKGTCTEGGKESGEVEGQGAILLASGQGLSINSK